MPGRDQTGPLGKGAQTGKRRGLCSHLNGENRSVIPESGRGQGMGPGRGRSMNGQGANRRGFHGFGR